MVTLTLLITRLDERVALNGEALLVELALAAQGLPSGQQQALQLLLDQTHRRMESVQQAQRRGGPTPERH